MSGAGLSTLYIFAQLIFSTAFEGHSYYPHFTDEEMRTKRSREVKEFDQGHTARH